MSLLGSQARRRAGASPAGPPVWEPEVMTDQAPEIVPEETNAVSDPAKLIRLGTMVQVLMDEVRRADTDEESRQLLARIHRETIEELGTILSADLMDELTEFAACCDSDGVPTEAEVRVAQAQLVGWLQGLLQGLQASMAQQQAVAAMQMQRLQAARNQSGKTAPDPAGNHQPPEQTGTYL